jgi:hypothetical protein
VGPTCQPVIAAPAPLPSPTHCRSPTSADPSCQSYAAVLRPSYQQPSSLSYVTHVIARPSPLRSGNCCRSTACKPRHPTPHPDPLPLRALHNNAPPPFLAAPTSFKRRWHPSATPFLPHASDHLVTAPPPSLSPRNSFHHCGALVRRRPR